MTDYMFIRVVLQELVLVFTNISPQIIMLTQVPADHNMVKVVEMVDLVLLYSSHLTVDP